MSGLAALERVSTTEQVVRALRAAIVSGSIAQGEQLREVQLATQLGTGRSAVREALRQLVQEGLAQHEVHRGTFAGTSMPLGPVARTRSSGCICPLARITKARSIGRKNGFHEFCRLDTENPGSFNGCSSGSGVPGSRATGATPAAAPLSHARAGAGSAWNRYPPAAIV